GIGDVCETDTDGDGVPDGLDAFPNDPNETTDTDGDNVGDNADAFPNDPNETTDTDGDNVGDNGDNCPTVANASQTNTDGDAEGDACDTDDDNDSVADGADNCPLVSNASQTDSDGNGVGDACDTLDATGVWNVTSTVSVAAEQTVGGCDANVGDVETEVVTITQDGAGNLVLRTPYGDNLTGTINTTTGDFSLSGTTTFEEGDTANPGDDTARVSGSEDLTMTGTGYANGTFAGTLQANDTWNGTPQCNYTYDLAGSFAYKHTGSEDYDGVYALEVQGEEWGADTGGGSYQDAFREGFPVELDFTATSATTGSVAMYFLDNQDVFSVTASEFNPSNGFFSVTVNQQQFDDFDGDTVIDESENGDFTLSGILMDPTGNTDGTPLMAFQYKDIWYTYPGDFNNAIASSEVTNAEFGGYAKRLTVTGHTRSNTFVKKNGTIGHTMLVGLLNAPLQNTSGQLYLRVLDPTGTTELCNTAYMSTDTLSGRYFEQINQPDPDMTALAFRGDIYSSVNCDTNGANEAEQIAAGDVLQVEIVDPGVDGLLDGTDDTVMYSTTVTADPVVNTADRFATVVDRNELNVNGVKPSRTLSGFTSGTTLETSTIELDGFFDLTEDIPVSWTASSESPDFYQLRVQEDFIKDRYTTTGTSVTLPAGAIDEWDGATLRLAAVKQDTNNSIAMSFSRKVKLRHGVYGAFNIELNNNVPVTHQSFVIGIEAGEGFGNCLMAGPITSYIDCSSASLDFATNTVTLNMVDIDGSLTGATGNFTLNLEFSDSASAQVTSPDSITGIPTTADNTTAARLAKSVVLLRTKVLSHNTVQRSQVNVTTPSPLYTRAILKRADDAEITYAGGTGTGTTALTIWDNTDANAATDYDNVVKGYTMYPLGDGSASGVVAIAGADTQDWGGINVILDPALYKVVMIDTTGFYPKQVHHIDYTAPSGAAADAYDAPDAASVMVNGAAVSHDSTTPTDLSGTGLESVSWDVSGYPADARFRIIFFHGDSQYQLRTNWLTEGVDGMTVDGSGIATWTPSTAVTLPPQGGNAWKISFRVGNNNSVASEGATVVGVSSGSTPNDDNSYVIYP
ncbi:MAG: thrombospondin type 3 repeat-containing protein, partial [Thioalkalispiraceae bacterium]